MVKIKTINKNKVSFVENMLHLLVRHICGIVELFKHGGHKFPVRAHVVRVQCPVWLRIPIFSKTSYQLPVTSYNLVEIHSILLLLSQGLETLIREGMLQLQLVFGMVMCKLALISITSETNNKQLNCQIFKQINFTKVNFLVKWINEYVKFQWSHKKYLWEFVN